MQGLKIPVIVLVFASVLGLAILTESLVHGRQVTNPLTSELHALDGVSEARVEGRGAKAVVYVHLEDDIDLIALYPEIQSRMEQYLGVDTGRLNLIDNRTDRLAHTYYDLRFQIEEALATGHFTQMAAAIAELVKASGPIDHKVYMDSHNVYVQLHQDDAYLYEVVPRVGLPPAANHS